MTEARGIPRIRVSGSARQRGEQLGRAAREQITQVRDGYERAFLARGISWGRAEEIARQYLPFIETHAPQVLPELEGMAAGSGLSFDEVLTLNCRSEVLYDATVRRHEGLARDAARPWRGECSAVGLEGDRTSEGRTLVAQNWDWLEALGPGVIVLEADRDDGPNYVTIVEAGLLAKMTMNAHGLAVGITTLVTTLDGAPTGLPFHVCIRLLADAPHLAGAVETLAGVPRATSGNYLLGSATGGILNLETSPGTAVNLSPQVSRSGAVVHTNHFLDPVPGGADLAALAMSDSFVRYGRLTRAVDSEPTVGRDALRRALCDHTEAPNAICCHPDPTADPRDRWATLASVILDPGARSIDLASGAPCATEWERLEYAEFLAL